MSRSSGNAVFPDDVLERGYTGRQLRHDLNVAVAGAALLADREAAREARDLARADELRARIEAEGYVLEDTPRGSRLRSRRSS